jgi:hypothetical protein
VVNDLFSNYQCFPGLTHHKIGSFTVEFNRYFLKFTSKFGESESNSFEEFKEYFGSSVGEIQQKLEGILCFPRFDHGNGLKDIANSLLFCAQEEIGDLCNYIELPKIEFFKMFGESDGFTVDRVLSHLTLLQFVID